ncbi:aminotransferase [Seonamhaeicola sp. S2-3]|uniref:DegT/DnrJ/EryC1/StrS family aminotransferase n=1 Tax=Seonamhaeicola sp. S2-3 TaxID=1936081 RepID=UPI0009726A30|nr:DegT/DnrJ/EryC1/StrS family aminotransferase [Seonamhaeicola sp. S2-3]APY10099.1 aminotransferase [Seonamhaeicola sp. S2-3]
MIKFLDLHKINKRFETQFQDKFQQFLNSGNYVLGSEVDLFEKEFATYCGTKHCIGVSSGLDALHLILDAYKILGKLTEGDEVIVPANTYIATILAVSHKGLKPILVEPNLQTYNIDTSKIESVISHKTKAILGVHLYGYLYNVKELERISKKHNLLLIEDAAQSHGAVNSDGRKAGNVSIAAAFSFYPTKNLGALGEAGAITTNDTELAKVVYKLRNYGRKTSYENDYKGYNCRLDEIQAAFLRVKLNYLDDDNKRRQENAKYYLSNINSENIVLPYFKNLKEHVFHLFVVRSKTRDALKDYLFKNGIETFIHYPIPTHKQNAYKEFNKENYPITEQIHQEVLSLPINQLLEAQEVEKIVEVISNFK